MFVIALQLVRFVRDKARQKQRVEKLKAFAETGEMPGRRKKVVQVCTHLGINFFDSQRSHI